MSQTFMMASYSESTKINEWERDGLKWPKIMAEIFHLIILAKLKG